MCSNGSLLPLAFAPMSESGPVMDLLVTKTQGMNVQIVFRFYPQTEGYNTGSSTSVAFYLNDAIYPGQLVRLSIEQGDDLLYYMHLTSRNIGDATWVTIAAPAPKIAFSPTSSCYVFFATCKVIESVCAIGLIIDSEGSPLSYPILPCEEVLPCQYSILAMTNGINAVYYNGNKSIPGDWPNAWQTVRWGGGAWSTVSVSTFPAVAQAAEDELFIRLLPGQLTPIAFRPYHVDEGTFPGEWAVVVTATIPPGTVVSLWCNNWSTAVLLTPWYKWTVSKELSPGDVVKFGNLGGTFVPWATHGILTVNSGYQSTKDITAITAYCGEYPVTGTYTCDYRDVIPTEFIPGVSIQLKPWPVTPSIICTDTCKRICDWSVEQLYINRGDILRWIYQTLPSYIKTCNVGSPCCCRPAVKVKYPYGHCGTALRCAGNFLPK
jgi:hypothetical protein